MTHKPCTICLGPVTIQDGELPWQWRKRRTCSAQCLKTARHLSALKAGTQSAIARKNPIPQHWPKRWPSNMQFVDHALAG